MSVTVERVTTAAQLAQCWALRTEVFVVEQGVPPEEEVDDLDTSPTTTHVAARDAAGVVVGTARLLSSADDPGVVHLGRMAVARRARGTGVGRAVVEAIHALALAEHAGADGRVRVELSAQEEAIGFYRRLGYEILTGERYLDAGIWHRDMAIVLPARTRP